MSASLKGPKRMIPCAVYAGVASGEYDVGDFGFSFAGHCTRFGGMLLEG